MYFSPLLRPSPIVGIISRLRMQFHTTVSQSRVHSAPIGLVMWNQKPPEKTTVSMPKAMEQTFKAKLCGQKFYFKCQAALSGSVSSQCMVFCPSSLLKMHISVKGLKLNCSLQAFAHDQSYTVGPAHPNASCMHFHFT